MRIVIIAMGSRGDVQPLIALGKGLQAAGHEVLLSAGRNFQPWIESHGLAYGHMDIDTHELMASQAGLIMTESGSKPHRMAQAMRDILTEYSPAVNRAIIEHSQGADVVLSGLLTDPVVEALHEATGVRHISTLLQPYRATPDGAANAQPPLPNAVSPINTLAAPLALGAMGWMVYRPTANAIRETLGLKPMKLIRHIRYLNRLPTLIPVDPLLVPPEGFADHVRVTGYWFLDETEAADWQPPADLLAFLEAGAPPVYIGFGSMTFREPAKAVDDILTALDRVGCRAVFYRGTMDVTVTAPESVYLLEGAPHRWLFPRMQAVVHHGGAGTTAAGLRAQRPTLIVPFLGDQPYWGRRVHAAGFGPAPIEYLDLTPDNLEAALRALLTWEPITAQLREDGVSRAVTAIEEWA